jgi:hypothetical protein
LANVRYVRTGGHKENLEFWDLGSHLERSTLYLVPYHTYVVTRVVPGTLLYRVLVQVPGDWYRTGTVNTFIGSRDLTRRTR